MNNACDHVCLTNSASKSKKDKVIPDTLNENVCHHSCTSRKLSLKMQSFQQVHQVSPHVFPAWSLEMPSSNIPARDIWFKSQGTLLQEHSYNSSKLGMHHMTHINSCMTNVSFKFQTKHLHITTFTRKVNVSISANDLFYTSRTSLHFLSRFTARSMAAIAVSCERIGFPTSHCLHLQLLWKIGLLNNL